MKTLIKPAIFTILIIAPIFLPHSTCAQDWEKYLPYDKVENGTLTLDDYREAFDKYAEPFNIDDYGYYFVNGKKERLGGWMQFKRWEWEVERQLDPATGQFSKTDAWTEWNNYLERFPTASRSAYGNWVELGPYTTPGGYQGLGRLNCIAFHPTLAGTFWVGAPTGGIWKTTSSGNSWTCLGDNLEIMGVSDIIIPDNYATSNTIYIATGDRDTWKGRSIGVLKSTNGGITWQETGLSFDRWDDYYVNRLLKLPGDDNTIYAATSDGVFMTSNGGSTFNRISYPNLIDMEFHPTNSLIMYGSTKASDDVTDIYRSDDGGYSWWLVFSIPVDGRVELAVSPDEPDWVYALACNGSGGLYGVYRSVNTGINYSLMYDGSLPNHNILGRQCDGSSLSGQGHYDLCIAVNPENALELYVGGINTWKSTDGGNSWNIINVWAGDCGMGIPTVHADKHNLVFRPGTLDLYECNDGGLYISTDLGVSWTDLSDGLAIGQIYRLSTAQTVTQDILTGYQDVGSKMLSGGVWTAVTGGDGMHNLIQPDDHDVQYTSTQNGGSIYRTLNHWASHIDIRTNIPDPAGSAWITPFVLHPLDPDILFVGLNDLWKSTDKGDTFTKIYEIPFSQEGLRAIAIAPSNTSIMVIANKWHIYKSTNGGATWTDITDNFPVVIDEDRLLSSIVIKHNDENTFWVTLGCYDIHRIYQTTDGGNTFTNISYGLPNVPADHVIENTLVTSYCQLYCATEAGVFLKLGDQPWLPFINGLPKVHCSWLDIYYDGANSKLRVGSWGRGVWESDLYSVESGMPGIWTGLVSTNWWDTRNWNYMVLPDANSDVTIPGNCPNYPVVTAASSNIKSLTIQTNASLTIGNNILTVEENATIAGILKMTDNSGILKVKEDLIWQAGSSADIQASGAIIIVEDDWTFQGAANVHLNQGYAYFSGGLHNSSIYNMGANASFHHLVVDKLSPRTLTYPSTALGNLVITGDFIILPANQYIHDASGALKLSGSFINSGDFEFNDGELIYSGPTCVLEGNEDCYFQNLTIDGASSYLSLGFEALVNGDIHIISGSLLPQSYYLHLLGNFQNDAGASGFIKGTSKILFEGTSEQFLEGETEFYRLTLNNGSSGLTITGGAISCEEYDWTAGTLEVQNGSFTAMDLADEGIRGVFIVQESGSVELHSTTFVHLKGDIYIINGTFDVYGGGYDSYWPYGHDASLNMAGGTLDFHDRGIFLIDSPTYTFSENINAGTIRTAGGFNGNSNNFNPDSGTIELYGPAAATVSHGSGSSFNNLVINKSAAADNSGPFQLNHHLAKDTIEERPAMPQTERPGFSSRPPDPPPGGSRSAGVTLSSDLYITDELEILSGEFDVGAWNAEVEGDISIYGTLVMNDPAGILESNQSIYWGNGADANVTEGQINFSSDWTFDNGAVAQLTNNNVVYATGTSSQTIVCKSSNAEMSNLFITNNTGSTHLSSISTRAVVATDQVILYPGCDLYVYDSLIVGELFLTETTSEVTLNYGVLVCNKDMTVEGVFHQLGGQVIVKEDLLLESTGDLVIDDGTFFLERPYSGGVMSMLGSTTINAGTMQVTNEGLQFGSASSFNSTNGTLKVGFIVRADHAGTFQPTGGTIEMIGDRAGQLRLSQGNWVNELLINKSPASSDVFTTDSLIVQGNVTIQSGELFSLGHKLILHGDLIIGLNGKLGPSSGDVKIDGDWTNNRGTDGFIESTSNVTFTGTGSSWINTKETFYRLSVKKPNTASDELFIMNNKAITINNNLFIQDGVICLNTMDTLAVGGNISILSGAGLNAGGSAISPMIKCGGSWEDFNSAYDENTGFNPGYSTVIFTASDADQFLIHQGNDAQFYKLNIDNPGTGWFKPSSNITIQNDCKILNGHWGFDETNRVYHFLEDLRIESTGYWEDTTCSMRFEGTDDHWCINFGPQPIRINNLYIDKETTTSDGPGTLILYGDVEIKSLARILKGELVLNGNTLTVENQFWIDTTGTLSGLDASTVSLHDGAVLLVTGGKIEVAGVALSPIFTSPDGYYTFSVVAGGEVDAKNTIFENMDLDGLHIYNNGAIGSTWTLEGCTFRDGEPGGTLLKINNNQDLEISGSIFPDSPTGGNINVTKPNNSGKITFTDASGSFSGPLYENDPFNRIHWDGIGEWTGLVSVDWHAPANWRFDLVPDEYIHAYVPDSTPNDPSISNANADCYALTLESEAILTLSSGKNITIDSGACIWGDLVLSSNEILTTSDITWKPGSNAIMSSNSLLRLFGNMTIENGSDLELLDGTVEFTGGLPSHLICLQDSATLYNLTVNKTAGVPFYFDASSTGDLFILSDLYNNLGNYIYANAPVKIYVGWGYYNYGGYLRAGNSHFVFNGDAGAYPIRMNNGDYFNDLTIESSSRLDFDNAFSDTIQVRGDLVINGTPGLSGLDANGIFMLIKGNWDNNVGATGFIHGNNLVEFSTNTTTNVSGDNIFYEFRENTTGTGQVRISGNVEVERSLFVNHKVRVYNSLTISNLLLNIPGSEFITQATSYVEVSRFRQGGTLTNSGNFVASDLWDARLVGTYNIIGGLCDIQQDASNTIDLAANITMSGGTMLISGGSGISRWPAQVTGSNPVITISGGVLDFATQGIHIEDVLPTTSITDNITGGTIRTTGHFYCRGAETGFSPAGGIIELYGNSNTDCEMSGTDNAFWTLKISKTSGNAVKNPSSINILNQLIIHSGSFDTRGNPVYIGN